MYARVSTFEGPAGLTEDQIAAMNDELESGVLPKVRAMAGFNGLISLLDNETGRAISVTLWESEEAMKASDTDATSAREEAADIERSRVIDVSRYQVTILETP